MTETKERERAFPWDGLILSTVAGLLAGLVFLASHRLNGLFYSFEFYLSKEVGPVFLILAGLFALLSPARLIQERIASTLMSIMLVYSVVVIIGEQDFRVWGGLAYEILTDPLTQICWLLPSILLGILFCRLRKIPSWSVPERTRVQVLVAIYITILLAARHLYPIFFPPQDFFQ